MITPRGERLSQLRMKVLINEEQKLDRRLMTALWQRIEREAMLDMPPSARRPTRTATRSSDYGRARE